MPFETSHLFKQGSELPKTLREDDFPHLERQVNAILEQFPGTSVYLIASKYKTNWSGSVFRRFFQYVRAFVIPDQIRGFSDSLFEWN